MRIIALLNRLLRYGVVGGTAAAVHFGVLLLLGQWMALSLANPSLSWPPPWRGISATPC